MSKVLLLDHDKNVGNKPSSNSLYSSQSSSVKVIHNEIIQGKEKNQCGDNINPSKSTCFC